VSVACSIFVDNLPSGYSFQNFSSREEMTKVATYSPPGSRARAVENVLREAFAEDAKGQPTVWSVGDAIEAMPVNPKPQECKHGIMILKEGIAKTGKTYHG